KSAQIREILISESAWEEMTCLFAPSLDKFWPQMTSERIISRSTYHDGTQERSELVEILSDIVSMTR
ncbi:hypothetical protein AAG991_07730, partial [Enterobacter kobei]|nr:hypothetical protein [Escherichia coli]